jgi:hypothetical protein
MFGSDILKKGMPQCLLGRKTLLGVVSQETAQEITFNRLIRQDGMER